MWTSICWVEMLLSPSISVINSFRTASKMVIPTMVGILDQGPTCGGLRGPSPDHRRPATEVLRAAECSPQHLSHPSQVLSDLTPRGVCRRHAESWTRTARWRSPSATLALPQPPARTKRAKMAVLLPSRCPPTATSTSPGVSSNVLHAVLREARRTVWPQRARRSRTSPAASSVGCRHHFARPRVAKGEM